MGRKETLDRIEAILVLLFNTCKSHTPFKLKISRFKNLAGHFHLMERNSVQVVFEDPEIRLKTDQEGRISFFRPEHGTIEFSTNVVGFGKIRRAQKDQKTVHVLNIPKTISLDDRRDLARFKLPLREVIWVYFDLGELPEADSPNEKADNSQAGESKKAPKKPTVVICQLIDLGGGGICTGYPRDRSKPLQLVNATPPLSATIDIPDKEIQAKLELVKDKRDGGSSRNRLRFRIHKSDTSASKQIVDYIKGREQASEEKELKRINMVLSRRSKIIDPRTLQPEMKEEELDRLKWRRKDNTFFIQTDRLYKG
ncbi:hypothetical protein ACFLT7_05150, partial [candidate division KSB1 bacterium]